MAEAGMAAYGAAAGVAITLAIVLFALRGKGHPEELNWGKIHWLQECTCMCGCKRLDLESICCVCKVSLCNLGNQFKMCAPKWWESYVSNHELMLGWKKLTFLKPLLTHHSMEVNAFSQIQQ